MVQGKVEICGVNTAKLPLLKAADKEALFAKIREGDTAARETYIEGNLRLVLSVIKRFSGSAENVDDLFQIGCIGLIKAIDNFDSTLGVKFSTYAVPMIIGEIRRYLRDNNSIRVSRSLKDTAYKAIYAKDTLTRKNLKEPTVEEIAAEVGISKEDIVYALDAMQNPMSLYEPVYILSQIMGNIYCGDVRLQFLYSLQDSPIHGSYDAFVHHIILLKQRKDILLQFLLLPGVF